MSDYNCLKETTNKGLVMKYALSEAGEIDGVTLYRVIALKNFGDVKAGDVGGFVESRRNLSRYGNAWISDDASVFGTAKVTGNARVSDNAMVYGNAWVSGNARVSDNAIVYENAWVYDNALVSGNSRVYGDTFVSGNTKVFGDANVSLKAITLPVDKYTATICGNNMSIGCQSHSLKEWWGFSDKEIDRMGNDGAVDLWKVWKPILKVITKAGGKP